jgi:RNA polymerase sigma factor (sigma-70 family)
VRNTHVTTEAANATADPSFAALYARSKDAVFRAVLLAVRHQDRAEDAVQEAYSRALARWDQVAVHPNQVGWLVKVALNADRSRLRVWRREQARPPHTAAPADEGSVDPWLLQRVWDLPLRQRQVVALRILADLDTAQTAAALGIAPGTVTAHLHRALSSLRTTLSLVETTEATS